MELTYLIMKTIIKRGDSYPSYLCHLLDQKNAKLDIIAASIERINDLLTLYHNEFLKIVTCLLKKLIKKNMVKIL